MFHRSIAGLDFDAEDDEGKDEGEGEGDGEGDGEDEGAAMAAATAVVAGTAALRAEAVQLECVRAARACLDMTTFQRGATGAVSLATGTVAVQADRARDRKR